MSWTVLLYGLLPLIAFAIADLFAGIKWGVAAAIAGAVFDIALTRVQSGEWDPGSFVALGLVVLLGGVTIKLGSTIYFKMQPAAVSLMYAGILAYYQLHGPSLVERYMPMILEETPPEYREKLDDPVFYEMLNGTMLWMIPFFVFFAVLIGFVGWRCKTVTWLAWRGVGFWVLLCAFVVVRMVVFLLRSA